MHLGPLMRPCQDHVGILLYVLLLQSKGNGMLISEDFSALVKNQTMDSNGSNW